MSDGDKIDVLKECGGSCETNPPEVFKVGELM